MRRIVVRYKAKPDQASENVRLIENVFAELRARAPEGLRYLVLKLDDGTFVHFASVEDGAASVTSFDAFRTFQSNIGDRCAEPPASSQAVIVGNYRMLGE